MVFSFFLKESNMQMQNRITTLIKSQTRVESKQSGIHSYYDTFDWRLYLRGLHLYLAEGEIVLYNFKEKKVVLSEPYERKGKEETLEISGKIQKKISPLIGIRRLLQMAIFQKHKQVFRLQNADQKTIARMIMEQSMIKSEKAYHRLNPCFEFHPLKGYDKEVNSILKKFSRKDLTSSNENLLLLGLKVLKKKPGSYTSKIKITLTPHLSADKAMKIIYLHLMKTLKSNENGIIKDFDTEFLHDFRVSVRRTRSGLSQLKNIFEQEITQKAKLNFSLLGQATNKLRDIDVYLLKEIEYKKMLPLHLRDNLDPFFSFLRLERKKEHRSLVRLLRSEKYKLILRDWEVFLKKEDAAEHRENRNIRPIIEVAREVIRKRNQRIVKYGKKILQTSSDELLHKLRIEAKKLRYLIEFFSSLFPHEQIQKSILKLKQLQDNLGELNDLVVQQNSLKNFSESLPLKGNLSINTVLTLGILIGKLHEKEQSMKKSFTKNFDLYLAQNVQKKFRQLFGVSGGGT